MLAVSKAKITRCRATLDLVRARVRANGLIKHCKKCSNLFGWLHDSSSGRTFVQTWFDTKNFDHCHNIEQDC